MVLGRALGEEQSRPARAANLVTREITGETVILPVCRGAVDITSLYLLNATGSFLWSRLDGKRTVGDLVELLVAWFQVDRPTAEADVEEFLESLGSAGLVQ